jgi:Tol biopolymer transport system component
VGFPTGSNEVSRDGKSIVFSGFYRDTKEAPGGMHIFTVPAEGGDAKQILAAADSMEGSPCWSPDGKWIAYFKHPLSPTGWDDRHIWVVSSQGGTPRQLTADADLVYSGAVRWSPDGQTIAYFGTDKTIRLIPAAGGKSRVLARLPLVSKFQGLSWSSDSSKLAYTANKEVRVIPASGGEPQVIQTGFDGVILQIDWSPDGQTFAFTGVTGGEEEIWLMSDFLPRKWEDGKTVARLLWGAPDADTSGEVSPDGRYLSYVDWVKGGDLAIRDLKTGQTRWLTNKGGWEKSGDFALNPRWSPDGKRVAYAWSIGQYQ